jgi:TonB-linked SusC/RagA family outer membrane protein
MSRIAKVFLLGLLCCTTLQLMAQNNGAVVNVNITVTDNNSEPLPGASIRISDKKQGLITDNNGKVSFWANKNSVITISYLGMDSRSIRITRPLSGVIRLSDKSNEIDQVVVTGYQRTTKRRTTGSVAVVTADELKDKPTANLDMLLQGKVAGVDVKAISGRPGESAKIRIRGTNTITGNADPLWVVDGVPLQKDIPSISTNQIRAGDFNDIFANGISGINPNDIESVTVLKDASAAAIYGSRAAGGVIVVTTKRGKEGKMNFSYSTNLSIVASPPRDANLMNSKEKLAWEQELWDEFSASGYKSGGYYPVIGAVGMIRSGYGKYAGMTTDQQDAAIASLGESTTDWFKELFRNSVSTSHYLSMSGGSKTTQYYASVGYAQNKGLVMKTDYDRYNVNMKLDMKPNKRVSIGLSADMSMQVSNSPSLNVDPFQYAYFANPYEKPYNEDGSYAGDQTYFSLGQINGSYSTRLPEGGYNIFREINETSSKTKNFSTSLIASMSVKILDNLNFEGLGSYGYVTNTNDNINGKNTYAAWMDRPFETNSITSTRTYGSIAQSSSYNTNYNLRGQLHYFDTFKEKHYVSALFGAEIRGSYSKSIYEKRYGYDPVSGNSAIPVYPEGTKVEYSNLLSYASIIDGLSGQSIVEDAFASFYFSADYVYNNRYVLSVTGRTDGSNNFGSKEQFNPTGSLGLSWNIDQEKFMEKLKPIISSMSVRAAFGYTGNINKTVYPQLVMDYSNSFRRTNDDYYRMGYLKNAPNPKLRWEKTRDMKLSVDVGFLKDRIRLQAEVYDRRTSDAVTNVSVPYTTGFSTQSYNTSKLLNQGAELSISAQVLKTKDWSAGLSANIAYNRNKLLAYNSPSKSMFGTTYVGYPLGAIISGKVQGIDKRLGIYTYEARPDAVFETAADRNVAENYAFYLGTSTPTTNGGYSVHVSYKKLYMSIGGTYSLNGKVVNSISCPVSYSSLDRGAAVENIPAQENDLYINHLNVNKDVVNRWTVANPITTGHPRIIDAYGEYLGLSNYMVSSSVITRASMMENISYFKVGSLSMGYSWDNKEWLKRLHISSISVSATVSNLLILTNYDGIDPETPGAVYPTPRTYTMGLSVGF